MTVYSQKKFKNMSNKKLTIRRRFHNVFPLIFNISKIIL